MTTERATEFTNRPYPPPSNVISILSRLRNRNLPEVVDAEYLRDASVPEGTNSRTLFALRFLGCIVGAGEPTPALRSIAISTDEEYMATLAELIREAYSEVFVSVDPSQDDQRTIVNFFRRYTPASQRERMVIFFLGMCREASIPTMDVPRKRTSNVVAGGPGQAPGSSPQQRTRQGPAKRAAPKGTSAAPALDGLIQSLPPIGQAFPQARRDQWLDMVRATLAYLYTEEAEEVSVEEEGPDIT